MIRITIFTGKDKNKKRVEAVETAVQISQQHHTDLLILPGSSLGPCKINGDFLQLLSDSTGVPILAETEDTYYFRPYKQSKGPFIQHFFTSGDATEHRVREVIDELRTGQRIIKNNNIRIGILLCGENNILRNVRANDNHPEPRYSNIGWPFDYDILVNPAHTNMRQWNLLHKRFAYFSKRNRIAIHCANNINKSWRTTLCVYRNEKLVTMGDFDNKSQFQHYIAENWRLITIAV
jgi:hypothetical protein